MPIDKSISNLVINKIPTQEIYNKLKEQDLINEDELYLVESGGSAEGAINIIKRTIEMRASSWTNNEDGTFSQPVVIDDGEVDCIVELQPDDDQILQLISDKTTSLRVDNDEGNFIAVATGAAPSVDLSIQATIIGIFEELPELDIIPISRGGTGATTAEEALENLGAAPVSHTHSDYASSSHTHDGYASSSHKHTTGDITSGTLSVSRGGTGKSTLTSGSFLKGNGTSAVILRTPAQVLSDIGAAAASHTHPASEITAGTLPAGVYAKIDTDYTSPRLRNIYAGPADMTAGTSQLANGTIYLVYE